MARKTWLTHGAILLFLFVVAAAVNSAPTILSGISPVYRLSSDATVHVVDWQEFSKNYAGNFEQDEMFQNYQAQATGVLFADKALVKIAEALGIELLTWSIVISALALALFLSGVYFVTLYSTKNILLSFLVALVSTVPVISLGLSSWSFLVQGFVPKEISLAIAVWLTLLYLVGVSTNSKLKIAVFFLLLGLFSNWYPVLFFHYALILMSVEVIRARAIRKEHVAYGFLFLAAAPIALFDIFIKSSYFTPPDLSIILDHYTEILHSWEYLIFHYLRKQIIYIALVGGLWYVYRQVLKKEYPPLIQLWYAVWLSALTLSLVGVGTEIFAPAYAKYLLSRVSVWFYFASMIIVAYTAYEIYFAKFKRSIQHVSIFSLLLVIILLGQTSVLNVWSGIKESGSNSEDTEQYLSVVTQLQSLVPTGSLVLANPNDEANTLRAYGGVGTYVSHKDGNVALFDGVAATKWSERYKETQDVFATKDFSAIKDFARAHDLQYYLFDKRDIENGTAELKAATIVESGQYGLAKIE